MFGGKTEFRESLDQHGRVPRHYSVLLMTHISPMRLFCLRRSNTGREKDDGYNFAIPDALPQICKEGSAGIEGSASIAISDVQEWELHPAE